MLSGEAFGGDVTTGGNAVGLIARLANAGPTAACVCGCANCDDWLATGAVVTGRRDSAGRESAGGGTVAAATRTGGTIRVIWAGAGAGAGPGLDVGESAAVCRVSTV